MLTTFKVWCNTLYKDLQDIETSIKMAKIVFGLPMIAGTVAITLNIMFN